MLLVAKRAAFAVACGLVANLALAQEPAVEPREDLDVTMRVIVDPNARLPDEIVRRIPLPRAERPPGPPAGAGKSEDKDAGDAPPGRDVAAEAREQGREFGKDVAERAREMAEEARRNAGPPDGVPGPPVTPPGPPETPPGPPVPPPGPPGP